MNRLADGLIKNYPYTPYASLAALQLAKLAVNQNNLTEAADKLIWIIDHGHDQALQSIARLRLARILLTQNQAKQALNILSKNEDNAYTPIFLEEKGDILNNLGRSKQALQNYLAAEKAFGNIIEQPLLEMKINNLAYCLMRNLMNKIYVLGIFICLLFLTACAGLGEDNTPIPAPLAAISLPISTGIVMVCSNR